jgi:hypothetical protein
MTTQFVGHLLPSGADKSPETLIRLDLDTLGVPVVMGRDDNAGHPRAATAPRKLALGVPASGSPLVSRNQATIALSPETMQPVLVSKGQNPTMLVSVEEINSNPRYRVRRVQTGVEVPLHEEHMIVLNGMELLERLQAVGFRKTAPDINEGLGQLVPEEMDELVYGLLRGVGQKPVHAFVYCPPDRTDMEQACRDEAEEEPAASTAEESEESEESESQGSEPDQLTPDQDKSAAASGGAALVRRCSDQPPWRTQLSVDPGVPPAAEAAAAAGVGVTDEVGVEVADYIISTEPREADEVDRAEASEVQHVTNEGAAVPEAVGAADAAGTGADAAAVESQEAAVVAARRQQVAAEEVARQKAATFRYTLHKPASPGTVVPAGMDPRKKRAADQHGTPLGEAPTPGSAATSKGGGKRPRLDVCLLAPRLAPAG